MVMQCYGNGRREYKARKNGDHLRTELPALRWMGNQIHPLTYRNETTLDDKAKIRVFCSECKYKQRCTKHPYDQLLTNSVLKANYRWSFSVMRMTGASIRPGRMWITYEPSCPL